MPARIGIIALFPPALLACNSLTGIDGYKNVGDGSTGDSSAVDAGGDASGGDAGDAPSGDPGISCGAAYCNEATQNCCRSGGQACQATSVPCNGGSQTLPCDDTADCATKGMPNTVCCYPLSNGGAALDGVCTSLASCPAMRIILCDPKITGECAAVGGSCLASTVPNMIGYYDCR